MDSPIKEYDNKSRRKEKNPIKKMTNMNDYGKMIIAAYHTSMNPATPKVDRDKATSLCDEFKANIRCSIPLCFEWALANDDSIKFFGFHCIEHAVKFSWTKFSNEEKVFIKNNLLSLSKSPPNNNVLRIMLARCLSEIAKREWPQQWPNMLVELEEAGQFLALKVFIEDIFCYETLPINRKRDLASAVQAQIIPNIIPQLGLVLSSNDTESINIALSMLIILLPMYANVESFLPRISQLLLQEPNRVVAAECLLSILNAHSKRHISFYANMRDVLTSLANEDFTRDEAFANKFSEFLYVLISHQIASLPDENPILARIILLLTTTEYLLTQFFSISAVVYLLKGNKLWFMVSDLFSLVRNVVSKSDAFLNIEHFDDDLELSRNKSRIRASISRLLKLISEKYPQDYVNECASILLSTVSSDQFTNDSWKLSLFYVQALPSDASVCDFTYILQASENIVKSSVYVPPLLLKYLFPISCINKSTESLFTRLLSLDIVMLHGRPEPASTLVTLVKSSPDMLSPFYDRLLAFVLALPPSTSTNHVSAFAEALLILASHLVPSRAAETAKMVLQPAANFLLSNNHMDAALFDTDSFAKYINESENRASLALSVQLLIAVARNLTCVVDWSLELFAPFLPKLFVIYKLISQPSFMDRPYMLEKFYLFFGLCIKIDVDMLRVYDFFSLSTNIETLPSCVLRSFIRVFLKPLIMYCPKSIWESFLLPFLANVFQQILLTLRNGYTCDDNLSPEIEASLQESLAFLSRDYVEILRQFAFGHSSNLAESTSSEDVMVIEDELDHWNHTKSNFSLDLSEVARFLFEKSATLYQTVIFSCFEGLCFPDTHAVMRLVILCLPLVKWGVSLFNEEFVVFLMTACLKALNLHGEHDCMRHDLILTTALLYETLFNKFPVLDDFLLKTVPNLTLENLIQYKQALLEALDSKALNDKKRKKLALSIFSSVVGTSISQRFKLSSSIPNLTPFERPVKEKQTFKFDSNSLTSLFHQ